MGRALRPRERPLGGGPNPDPNPNLNPNPNPIPNPNPNLDPNPNPNPNPNVRWQALPAVVPTWLVMLLIVTLDNMLKLASTESALAIDFDYNHEMLVGGVSTVTAALLGGSPAYSQTKFNVLNHAMTHSTASALPSVVCALFCGALFPSGRTLTLSPALALSPTLSPTLTLTRCALLQRAAAD